MRIKRNQGGFTLIELMLVIAIIGLLATVVLLGQHDTSVKRRDTKRYADAKQIQQALALYVAKMQSYPVFTGCMTGADAVNTGFHTQALVPPNNMFVDPFYPTDVNKCYYYSGTPTTYSFHYTIEKDSSVGPAGTITVVP